MINNISNWAEGLIVSLIIVTIIEMLLPNTKLKKYVKTVIGVYIIFCLISPFINKKEFAEIFEDTQKSLEKMQIENQVSSLQNENSSIEELYIQEFQKDIVKKVEELGYKVNKCNVDIEINATKENAGVNAIYLNIEKGTSNKDSENIGVENVEKVEISINDTQTGNNKKETEDTKKVKEFLSNYYEISKEKIKIIQD